jgi:hypothetical protein
VCVAATQQRGSSSLLDQYCSTESNTSSPSQYNNSSATSKALQQCLRTTTVLANSKDTSVMHSPVLYHRQLSCEAYLNLLHCAGSSAVCTATASCISSDTITASELISRTVLLLLMLRISECSHRLYRAACRLLALGAHAEKGCK